MINNTSVTLLAVVHSSLGLSVICFLGSAACVITRSILHPLCTLAKLKALLAEFSKVASAPFLL